MDFKFWLDKNKHILKKYRDIQELGELARACGFSIEEVSAVLPEWHVDLLTRTTHRQRAAYFVDREIKTLSHYQGNPDLAEQWHHLYYQIEYGKDWQ